MVDKLLVEIAARQLGLITRRDVQSCGLDDHHSKHRRRIGRFIPVHPGVYRDAAVPTSLEQEILAVCLALGPDAMASHRTAGHVHRLLPSLPAPLDVVIPFGLGGQAHGARIHRSRQIEPVDRVVVGPLPLTSPVRTVIDLASCLHPAHLDDVIGRGLTLRLFRAKEIVMRLDELGARGFRGAAALRVLLDDRIDDPETESQMERELFRLLRARGLPSPVTQHEVRDPSGQIVARCDFAYPQRRLAVEYDGREAHLHDAAFDDDRERDARLAALGWHTLRVTKRTLRQPEAFLAAVSRHLAS